VLEPDNVATADTDAVPLGVIVLVGFAELLADNEAFAVSLVLTVEVDDVVEVGMGTTYDTVADALTDAEAELDDDEVYVETAVSLTVDENEPLALELDVVVGVLVSVAKEL